MAHHAQMTADEWVEDAVNNSNPTDDMPRQVYLQKGTVIAWVKGGMYTATVEELSKTLAEYHTPQGTKLLNALVKRSGGSLDHQIETRQFYAEATPFELAVILAWYDSRLNHNSPNYW